MRKCVGVLGSLLVLAGPALAQLENRTTFFGGVDRKNMVFKPIDTSKAVAPVPVYGSHITLGGLLTKLGIPGLGNPAYRLNPLPGPSMTAPATNPQSPFQPVAPIYPKR